MKNVKTAVRNLKTAQTFAQYAELQITVSPQKFVLTAKQK